MNKPQCTTAAQCLKELARVMEQFGLSSIMFALKSDYIKWRDGTWSSLEIPDFTQPNYWQFAIAEVEGKPVFIGDELYGYGGAKILVTELRNREQVEATDCNTHTLLIEDISDLSLSPAWHRRLSEACKLALEKLK